MRIAFLVGKFPSPSETFILNQVVGLLENGHQVDIYATHPNESAKNHPDVERYHLLERTYYYPELPKKYWARIMQGIILGSPWLMKKPLAILRSLNVFKYKKQALSLRLLYSVMPFLKSQEHYDIIHCHFANVGLLGLTVREILELKAKLITTFYGYDVNAYPKEYGKDVYHPLFEKGDAYIAISTFIAEEAISLGCPKHRLIKLPLGINPLDYPFRARSLKMEEPIKITTVARLVEKKGLEYSIKAVAELLKIHPNLRYRIAGNGYLFQDLESLISSLGVEGKIQLLGWQTKDEVRNLYDDSHIFVLASITASNGDKEGQGLVLQEAQAMGLPVIATLHNGFPDSVRQGISAYLVAERNVQELFERLKYLVEHPEDWAEMGSAGRAFVENNFSLQKLDQQLIDIYRNLLDC